MSPEATLQSESKYRFRFCGKEYRTALNIKRDMWYMSCGYTSHKHTITFGKLGAKRTSFKTLGIN